MALCCVCVFSEWFTCALRLCRCRRRRRCLCRCVVDLIQLTLCDIIIYRLRNIFVYCNEVEGEGGVAEECWSPAGDPLSRLTVRRLSVCLWENFGISSQLPILTSVHVWLCFEFSTGCGLSDLDTNSCDCQTIEICKSWQWKNVFNTWNTVEYDRF